MSNRPQHVYEAYLRKLHVETAAAALPMATAHAVYGEDDDDDDGDLFETPTNEDNY